MALPVYGTLADLARLAPSNALAGVSVDSQNDFLARWSRKADDALQSVYTLPLVSWPTSLTDHVCYGALADILLSKGAAAAETKLMYDGRRREAIAFFAKIEGGQRLNGLVDSSPDPTDEPDQGFPVIDSIPRRGW